MAIGGVKAMDSMAGWQGSAARRVDYVSKNIQNEISTVERQKQGLSSKQEMSVEEKTKKKQELQQELSSLNAKLRQRQEEVSREQKKEALTGEVRAADGGVSETEKVKGNADMVNAEKVKADGSEAEKKNIDIKGTEKENAGAGVQAAEKDAEDARGAENEKNEKLKDIGIPQKDAQSIVKGDSLREQTKRRESVIARMEGGIAILKGEIRQDELRGADTEKKKAELKKQEKKVQKAASGIPNVKGPSKAADAAARIKAGEEKGKAGVKGKTEAGVVKSSRDGVVIITPNALENGIW
ncbi:MAG: hypothetical protein K2K63_09810 [Acetatifactor sp.]|nr:hypothetical protein [Acetatifactor sp.]